MFDSKQFNCYLDGWCFDPIPGRIILNTSFIKEKK